MCKSNIAIVEYDDVPDMYRMNMVGREGWNISLMYMLLANE